MYKKILIKDEIKPVDKTQTHKVIRTTKETVLESAVRHITLRAIQSENKLHRKLAEQQAIAKYEAEKAEFAEEFKLIEQAVSKYFNTMYKR
ncbi:hypothetical protein [Bacillus bombysepticus]|uniref:hypothetical protein n=1 Tax=Bacillus bombysepticus TaxID=658666 RepID=UPI00301852E2